MWLKIQLILVIWVTVYVYCKEYAVKPLSIYSSVVWTPPHPAVFIIIDAIITRGRMLEEVQEQEYLRIQAN